MIRFVLDSLAKIFSIDPRSLAVFRIVAGILLLVDLAIRATDLEAFYTDRGAVPRALLSEWHFPSLHTLSGDVSWQGCLFLLAALFAVGLLVGWQTRLVTILSWFFLCSLHARNPWLQNAGDTLLRMLLFWGMFLPLGGVWSLDARRKSPLREPLTPVLSVAGGCLLLQVCLMYWFSAYHKYNEVWRSGDALYYTFSYDAYARPLATYLLQYQELLRWMTFGALALEAFGPLVALSPWGTKSLRLLVIAAFIGLHLSIELTLTVGLFSYASLLAWIPFLPDKFWNLFSRSAPRVKTAMPEVSPALESSAGYRGLLNRRMRLPELICIGVMLYVLLICYSKTYLPGAKLRLVKQFTRPANMLMLSQSWGMFGRPIRTDGWCVAAARLADGRTIDLLRAGATFSWEKPERVADLHANHRRRKYFSQIVRNDRIILRSPLCQYLARSWNETHPESEQILWLDLYQVKEQTPEPGLPLHHQQVLLRHEPIGARGAFEEALIEATDPSANGPGASDLPPGI